MKRAILFLLLCVLAVASFRVDAQQYPLETAAPPFRCMGDCIARVGRSGSIYIFNWNLILLTVQHADSGLFTTYDLSEFATYRTTSTYTYGFVAMTTVFDILPLEGVNRVAFFTGTTGANIRLFDLQSRTMETLAVGLLSDESSIGQLAPEGCGFYIGRPALPNSYIVTYGDESHLMFCTITDDEIVSIHDFDVEARSIVQTIVAGKSRGWTPEVQWWRLAVGEDGTLNLWSWRGLQVIDDDSVEWSTVDLLAYRITRSIERGTDRYPEEYLIGVDERGRYYFAVDELTQPTFSTVFRYNPRTYRTERLAYHLLPDPLYVLDVTSDGRLLIKAPETPSGFQLIHFDDYAQMIPLPRPFPFPTQD